MSVATVVTRGFLIGSATGLASVATRGYRNSSTPAVQDHGVAFHRRKTKVWEEEIPEVAIYETRAAELESLLDQKTYVSDLFRAAQEAERASLQRDLRRLNGQISATKIKLAKDQQEMGLAIKRYQEEEEEISQLTKFIVDLNLFDD